MYCLNNYARKYLLFSDICKHLQNIFMINDFYVQAYKIKKTKFKVFSTLRWVMLFPWLTLHEGTSLLYL